MIAINVYFSWKLQNIAVSSKKVASWASSRSLRVELRVEAFELNFELSHELSHEFVLSFELSFALSYESEPSVYNFFQHCKSWTGKSYILDFIKVKKYWRTFRLNLKTAQEFRLPSLPLFEFLFCHFRKLKRSDLSHLYLSNFESDNKSVKIVTNCAWTRNSQAIIKCGFLMI